MGIAGPRAVLSRSIFVLLLATPFAGFLVYVAGVPLQSAPGFVISGILGFVQDYPLAAAVIAVILVPFLFLDLESEGGRPPMIGRGP